MADVVEFNELERAERDDGDVVIVYEAAVRQTVFAYLYLNSKTYTVVWTGESGLQFDDRQPYTFVKQQFSYLSQAEISLLDVVLPDRRPRSEAIAGKQHFYYDKSVATLILADGESQSVVEYDLLDNDKHRTEYVENLKRPEFLSCLIFARYDSEVVSSKHGKVNACFTAERPRDEAAEGWEFTINLPRTLVLTKRVLRWAARKHQSAEALHKLDFEKVRVALSKILNPQEESVFLEEIR